MKTKIRKYLVKGKEQMLAFLFVLLRIYPIDKYKIVFSNFNGNGYGESTKYLAEEFLKDKKWKCVWLADQQHMKGYPEGIRVVDITSIKGFYEIVTAGVWVINVRTPIFFKKRKKQFYIQMWHGGIGLKKAEKCVADKLDKGYIKCAIHDSKQIDLLISNGKERTRLYRENFWYDGKILESGFPKTDLLINNNVDGEKIRSSLGIKDAKTRLLLYAPTFRDSKRTDWFSIDFKQLIQELQGRFGGKWEILLRMHPNTSEEILKQRDQRIHDVSKYPDISELLYVSDILISDYSSIIADISLCKKPVFLYIPDYLEYGQERGLKYELSELPYPVSMNNQELFQTIREYEDEEYLMKLDIFMKQFGYTERGHAAKDIYNYISKWRLGDKK